MGEWGEVGFSSQVGSGRTRKWLQGGDRRFRLDVREKVMERAVKYWKRLSM